MVSSVWQWTLMVGYKYKIERRSSHKLKMKTLNFLSPNGAGPFIHIGSRRQLLPSQSEVLGNSRKIPNLIEY